MPVETGGSRWILGDLSRTWWVSQWNLVDRRRAIHWQISSNDILIQNLAITQPNNKPDPQGISKHLSNSLERSLTFSNSRNNLNKRSECRKFWMPRFRMLRIWMPSWLVGLREPLRHSPSQLEDATSLWSSERSEESAACGRKRACCFCLFAVMFIRSYVYLQLKLEKFEPFRFIISNWALLTGICIRGIHFCIHYNSVSNSSWIVLTRRSKVFYHEVFYSYESVKRLPWRLSDSPL